MAIHFFYETGPHGFLANFSPHPVTINGTQWPTAEHYYQAQKHEGTPLEDEVRLASTPLQAKVLASDKARPPRPDWEQVREAVMRAVVRAKFTQHAELREALIATGEEELIEKSDDPYWGSGADGKGLNLLGRILMDVRQSLRDEAPSA